MRKENLLKALGLILFCLVVPMFGFHYFEVNHKLGLPYWEFIVFDFFILIMLYSKFNKEFGVSVKYKIKLTGKLFLIKLVSASILYCCSNSTIASGICNHLALTDAIIQSVLSLVIIETIFDIVMNVDL